MTEIVLKIRREKTSLVTTIPKNYVELYGLRDGDIIVVEIKRVIRSDK